VTTPRERGYAMPPAWARHGRYWTGWPSGIAVWRDHLDPAREAMAGLAALLAEHRPVTVLANPAEAAHVSLMCGPGVGAMIVPHVDCCLRAVGPTFLTGAEGVAGVLWRADADDAVGASILDKLSLQRFHGPLPLVSGMVDVDGEGTALASEALLDHAGRPREEVEPLLRDWLGVETVIWLRAGLEGDVSGGRLFNLARFLRPGLVLAPDDDRADDADSALRGDNLNRLRRGRDARGRTLEVVAVPTPKRRERPSGRRIVMSYANCFVDDGLIVLPAFEDGRDDVAYDRVVGALLDHTVVSYPAVEFAFGGGGLGALILSEPLSPRQT